MSSISEPEPARPWRPQDGPQPEVWTWSNNDRPALEVFSAGRWRYARVLARQDWADGSVYYQVEVDLRGRRAVTVCLYRWPQPGLRQVHGSSVAPSRGTDESRQGEMPMRGPTRRGGT